VLANIGVWSETGHCHFIIGQVWMLLHSKVGTNIPVATCGTAAAAVAVARCRNSNNFQTMLFVVVHVAAVCGTLLLLLQPWLSPL